MALGTILLVEDDASVRTLVERALSVKGFTVFAAENGERARQIMQASDPAAVLLDINLPDVDGIELCEQFRAETKKEMPIVFLTSSDTSDIVIKCLEAGGDDFVVKSAGVKAIINRVESWTVKRGYSDLAKTRAQKLERLRAALK